MRDCDRVGIGSVDLSAAPVTGVGCQQKLMPSLGGFGLPLSSRAEVISSKTVHGSILGRERKAWQLFRQIHLEFLSFIEISEFVKIKIL
jgi:hypothetical protein